jgi:hypothetical protein
MKNISNFIAAIALLLAIGAVGVATSIEKQSHAPQIIGGISSRDSAYSSAATSAQVTVGVAAVQVFAKNDNRLYAEAVNSTTTVFCVKSATSTGLTATSGTPTYSQGSIIFDPIIDPYFGGLFCLTSSGTSTLWTNER